MAEVRPHFTLTSRKRKNGILANNGCNYTPMLHFLTRWHFMIFKISLNPIQDGPFGCCSWKRRAKRSPSLKSVRHILQLWNFAQSYLTLSESKKIMNHVTHPLSSADISIFSLEISKFCYIKKYRYWVLKDFNKQGYNFDDVNENGYSSPS